MGRDERERAQEALNRRLEPDARVQRLRNRAQALLDHADLLERSEQTHVKLARMLASLETGTAILFTKTWGRRAGSKQYSYAAIKDGDGMWNTTGPRSPKKYSDQDLALWLAGQQIGSGNPVAYINRATIGTPLWYDSAEAQRLAATQASRWSSYDGDGAGINGY